MSFRTLTDLLGIRFGKKNKLSRKDLKKSEFYRTQFKAMARWQQEMIVEYR